MPAILGQPQPRDLVELPRHQVAEDWMDVQAVAFEARRDLGKALVDHQRGASPMPRLFGADQRLIRLTEFARRKAGEAEGISYIAPGQQLLPLADGCLDGEDGERGA